MVFAQNGKRSHVCYFTNFGGSRKISVLGVHFLASITTRRVTQALERVQKGGNLPKKLREEGKNVHKNKQASMCTKNLELLGAQRLQNIMYFQIEMFAQVQSLLDFILTIKKNSRTFLQQKEGGREREGKRTRKITDVLFGMFGRA